MLENGMETQPLETNGVRLVLCPKCRKLLPEFTGFSIYQCGSCNTTLQAKHSTRSLSSSSKKSDTPSSNTNSNAFNEYLHRLIVEERAFSSSSLLDQGMEGTEIGIDATVPVGTYIDSKNQIHADSSPTSDLRDEPNYRREPKKEIPSVGSQNVMKGKNKEEARVKAFETRHGDENGDAHSYMSRTPRTFTRKTRTPSYNNEGPYKHQTSFGYDAAELKNEGFRDHDHIAHLGKNEAEILRELDELRAKLLRSCKVKSTKAQNEYPKDRRAYYNKSFASNKSFAPSDLRGRSREDMYAPASHSIRQYPSMNEHIMDNYHQTMPSLEEMSMYNDPHVSYPSQLRSLPYQPTNIYGYRKFDQLDTMQHIHNHPAFYDLKASHGSQMSFDTKRSSYLGDSHERYPMDNHSLRGPLSHRSTSISSSHGPHYRHNSHFGLRTRHKCKIVAGGAPYIICNGCFEALQLPYHILRRRVRSELQCGECSRVVTIIVSGNALKIIEFESTDTKQDASKDQDPEVFDSSKHGSSTENTPSPSNIIGLPVPTITDLNLTDERNHSPVSRETKNDEGMPSSHGTSRDVSPKVPHFDQDADKSKDNPPLARDHHAHDSPSLVRDSLDIDDSYSSSERGVIKYVFGNIDEFVKKEKEAAKDKNYRHIPIKDPALVTELDLLKNEYPKPDSSAETFDVTRDKERSMIKKVDEAFIFEVEKQARAKPRQPVKKGKCKVSINGIPISDQIVAKASKRAGPIQPGDYWYDYIAGFWGILGEPCLGIIPSNMEEFNFPMPEDCAGGDSGVRVNGRELHRKDLELLASRGLPPNRGRSYTIEISGKVYDAYSGEELGNLGNLAPTVEKMGHGFGMRPKTLRF